MPEEKKQCGTCKFWESVENEHWANCIYPVPTSLFDSDKCIVIVTDGSDCPCYQSTNEKSN